MKKCLILIMLTICITGCSKDTVNIDDKSIIGNWINVNGDEWSYINLKSNGNFELSICSIRNEDNECYSKGTYNFKENILKLTHNWGDEDCYVVFETNGDVTITHRYTSNDFIKTRYKKR